MIGEKAVWINKEDVEKLRDQLKPGDTIEQEYEEEVELKNGVVERRIRKRKARVIAKYPHLVEVESDGPKRVTVTYHEILLRRTMKKQQALARQMKEQECR